MTKEIVDGQYLRVKNLLEEKKELVMALTERLMEKETVLYKDLVEVLGPRPVPLGAEMEKFVMATAKTMDDAKADGKILKRDGSDAGSGGGSSTPESGDGPGAGGEKVEQEAPMAPPAAAAKVEQEAEDALLKAQGWVLK
jgi:AFG3 family protein